MFYHCYYTDHVLLFLYKKDQYINTANIIFVHLCILCICAFAIEAKFKLLQFVYSYFKKVCFNTAKMRNYMEEINNRSMKPHQQLIKKIQVGKLKIFLFVCFS